MDALKFNKIAAALLGAVLLIMVFGKIADFLVHPNIEVSNSYPIEVANKAPEKAKDNKVIKIEPILMLLASANIEDGGKNKVGPNLYNIVNKLQAKEDFSYSKALSSLSGQWSYQELNKFLYKPKLYAKGTKMSYAGLSKVKDRANLIAWLRTKSVNPAPLP